MPDTALGIAGAVERIKHLLGQLGRLGDDGLHKVGRGIGKAGLAAERAEMKHIIEQKQSVFDWGFIARHLPLLCLILTHIHR